jgi:hypothetical protein
MDLRDFERLRLHQGKEDIKAVLSLTRATSVKGRNKVHTRYA